MRIFGVHEYVDKLAFDVDQTDECVVGAILQYRGQLLLLDEGTVPGFYKDNARLILKHDGADIMLRKLLPALGGGPSPFWEAAIAEVASVEKFGDLYVVTPKRIHYWDAVDEAFVPLVLDENLIDSERTKEIERSKARAEIIDAGEVDPFASAGTQNEDYWSNKL
jgi:hypothetical protein